VATGTLAVFHWKKIQQAEVQGRGRCGAGGDRSAKYQCFHSEFHLGKRLGKISFKRLLFLEVLLWTLAGNGSPT
jgi:hypothetical protein